MKALIPVVFAALLVGCQPDVYECYVYPSRGDLTDHIAVGRFDSLDACRAAARGKLIELDALEEGDYECGKNCRAEHGFEVVRVCEKTLE